MKESENELLELLYLVNAETICLSHYLDHYQCLNDEEKQKSKVFITHYYEKLEVDYSKLKIKTHISSMMPEQSIYNPFQNIDKSLNNTKKILDMAKDFLDNFINKEDQINNDTTKRLQEKNDLVDKCFKLGRHIHDMVEMQTDIPKESIPKWKQVISDKCDELESYLDQLKKYDDILCMKDLYKVIYFTIRNTRKFLDNFINKEEEIK